MALNRAIGKGAGKGRKMTYKWARESASNFVRWGYNLNPSGGAVVTDDLKIDPPSKYEEGAPDKQRPTRAADGPRPTPPVITDASGHSPSGESLKIASEDPHKAQTNRNAKGGKQPPKKKKPPKKDAGTPSDTSGGSAAGDANL